MERCDAIADFVGHVGAVSDDREASQALVRSLADAESLRTYADANGICRSDAEVLTRVETVKSQLPTGLHALSDTDLDAVSGACMPEGMSRIYDILHQSIVPNLKPS
ncbi:MAG: hypothetical protein B7Y75_00150 [Azorhizobium sp. 35-67-5]|nr:MAG: hypothetical protein B7Y75_00150 [Azorhizobium sp. 35-67-5]